jgi:hypothetical protein
MGNTRSRSRQKPRKNKTDVAVAGVPPVTERRRGLRRFVTLPGLLGFLIAIVFCATLLYGPFPNVFDPTGAKWAAIEWKYHLGGHEWLVSLVFSLPTYALELVSYLLVRRFLPKLARGFLVGFCLIVAFDVIDTLFLERDTCVNGCSGMSLF